MQCPLYYNNSNTKATGRNASTDTAYCNTEDQLLHQPDGRLPTSLDLLWDALRQHLRHSLREHIPHVVAAGLEQRHVHLLRAHLKKTQRQIDAAAS